MGPFPATLMAQRGAAGGKKGKEEEEEKRKRFSCTSTPSVGLWGEDGKAEGDEEEEVVEDGDEGDDAHTAPTSAGWVRFRSTCLLLAPGKEMEEGDINVN